MTETKFTPGPWEVSPVLPGYYEWVRNSDGHLVADCASMLPSEECVANAALISAAPDMYAALEHFTTMTRKAFISPEAVCFYMQKYARDIIAKARGEKR